MDWFNFIVGLFDPEYAKRAQQREWERQQKIGRQIYQSASYQAQRNPAARWQANLVVGCVLVPLLLLCIGAVVVFLMMNPNGISR